MMENKDFVSSISFKLRNENGEIVSFNGQSQLLLDYQLKKYNFMLFK